jgi:hypothetical protein
VRRHLHADLDNFVSRGLAKDRAQVGVPELSDGARKVRDYAGTEKVSSPRDAS